MAEGALTWFANRKSAIASMPVLQNQEPAVADMASASTPVLQNQEPEVADTAPESTPVLQNQEPAARRLARDGNWYTFAEFSEHYGCQAEEEWQEACSNVPVLNYVETEYRVASNGKSYTRAEFDKFYGDHAESKWEQASVSPGITFQKWSHTRGDGIKLSNQPDSDENPVLLAHSILLDSAHAKQLRETTSSHGLRKAMRAEQERLQALGVVNTSIAIDSDRVPWMRYIAHHKECDKIIGKGIVQFVAQFMPKVSDPNRSIALEFRCNAMHWQQCRHACRKLRQRR